MTDAENCGRCGHSCLSSRCVGGRCVPEVLDTDATSGGWALALAPPYVIWGTDELRWVDPTDLSYEDSFSPSSPTDFDYIAVFEDQFVATDRMFVYTGPADGSLDPAMDAWSAGPLAVDATGVYAAICGVGPGAIRKLDGSTNPPYLVDGIGCPYNLLIDGEYLWYTEDRGIGIYRVPKQPTVPLATPTLVASSPDADIWGMAIDEDGIYIGTNAEFDREPTAGHIFSFDKNGQIHPLTPDSPQWYPVRLAVQGDYVYWVARGNAAEAVPGAIRRARKGSTEAVEELASVGDNAQALAVDDRYVYWVTSTSTGYAGSLYRVAY